MKKLTNPEKKIYDLIRSSDIKLSMDDVSLILGKSIMMPNEKRQEKKNDRLL